uniref:Uncharacterized protein n=1 Tax=Rhizophora mucronata TaxID=61149 RepID=A0A2P2QJ55_RHIMU
MLITTNDKPIFAFMFSFFPSLNSCSFFWGRKRNPWVQQPNQINNSWQELSHLSFPQGLLQYKDSKSNRSYDILEIHLIRQNTGLTKDKKEKS